MRCDREENGRSENCNDGRQCFNRETFNVPDLSDEEIRVRTTGNLCRCACYPNILDAVAVVATKELNDASP